MQHVEIRSPVPLKSISIKIQFSQTPATQWHSCRIWKERVILKCNNYYNKKRKKLASCIRYLMWKFFKTRQITPKCHKSIDYDPITTAGGWCSPWQWKGGPRKFATVLCLLASFKEFLLTIVCSRPTVLCYDCYTSVSIALDKNSNLPYHSSKELQYLALIMSFKY